MSYLILSFSAFTHGFFNFFLFFLIPYPQTQKIFWINIRYFLDGWKKITLQSYLCVTNTAHLVAISKHKKSGNCKQMNPYWLHKSPLRTLCSRFMTLSILEITAWILLPDWGQVSLDWQMEISLQQVVQRGTKTDISMCLPRYWWNLEDSFMQGKTLFHL